MTDNTKPMNIDTRKYGLVDGFPERFGLYTAYLNGYDLGVEHQKQKGNR